MTIWLKKRYNQAPRWPPTLWLLVFTPTFCGLLPHCTRRFACVTADGRSDGGMSHRDSIMKDGGFRLGPFSLISDANLPMSALGNGSTSPRQAFRGLQPWPAAWQQSRERLWARAIQLNPSWSPAFRNLFKGANFGTICYAAIGNKDNEYSQSLFFFFSRIDNVSVSMVPDLKDTKAQIFSSLSLKWHRVWL